MFIPNCAKVLKEPFAGPRNNKTPGEKKAHSLCGCEDRYIIIYNIMVCTENAANIPHLLHLLQPTMHIKTEY